MYTDQKQGKENGLTTIFSQVLVKRSSTLSMAVHWTPIFETNTLRKLS